MAKRGGMMRRGMVAAVAVWLMVAVLPTTAVAVADEGSPDEAPILWQSYWEGTAPNDGYSYFSIEGGEATMYGDVGIVAFKYLDFGRRVVVDVEHWWGDADGGKTVTVRHWGYNGVLSRGWRGDSYCGEWESRWKVLEPKPLQRRFKQEGLSPIVPRGRGVFHGCTDRFGGGFLWATFDSHIRWRPGS